MEMAALSDLHFVPNRKRKLTTRITRGYFLGLLEAMNRDLGLAARHLTISTVGVVPGIRQLPPAGQRILIKPRARVGH